MVACRNDVIERRRTERRARETEKRERKKTQKRRDMRESWKESELRALGELAVMHRKEGATVEQIITPTAAWLI